MDFRNYCKGCGAELPDGPFAEVREWCGHICYMRHYNELDRQARIEAKRDRAPCEWCGGPVAPAKKVYARFCGADCREKAAYVRRRRVRA